MPPRSRRPAGRASPSGPRSSGRSRPRVSPDAGATGTSRAEPPSSKTSTATLPRPQQKAEQPRASLTTRAAVLLGVVAVLAASYAFPVRAWLDQRADLAAAEAERDALAAEVEELTEARDLWDDPAYIRAQARERLNFVLPGEVGLVVLGTESTPVEVVPTSGPVVAAVEEGQPWWSTIVASFTQVGLPTEPIAGTAQDGTAADGSPAEPVVGGEPDEGQAETDTP